MGKNIERARQMIDRTKEYSLEDAIKLLKECRYAKFDETVELAINLGVDPKKSDQMVRGTTILPHGTGKTVRVLVFAKGEKEKEARDAGADYVGAEDLVERIQNGWLDFDRTVATPDVMGIVGKLGKILGPRGLMPNPKVGTVTFDVAKAVKELKSGKIEFAIDKGGVVHVPIGKISFEDAKLADNARAIVSAIIKAKPAASKGKYLKKITISSTMGPGVKVDIDSIVSKKAQA